MARPASGKIRTSYMRQPQKNGDIYVFERQTLYDPEKKYTRNLSYKLIGKIKPGTTEIVPTRPKRKSKKEEAAAEALSAAPREAQAAMPFERDLTLAEDPGLKAAAKVDPMPKDGSQADEAAEPAADDAAKSTVSVQHIGSSDILAWVGEQSGIDEDLLAAFDQDKAEKLITIARWQLSSGGAHLSRIASWQMTHPTPCGGSLITREVYHKLFKDLAWDDDLQEIYFWLRTRRCDMSETALLDFAASPGFAGRSMISRLGCCCDGECCDAPYDELDADLYSGFQTADLMAAYSVKSRQPVALIRRRDQLPAQYGLQQAAQQLEQRPGIGGKDAPLLVTNSLLCSDDAAAFFVQNSIDFLGPVNVDLKWVQQQLKAHHDEVKGLSPSYPSFCGCTGRIEYVIEPSSVNNLVEKKIVPLHLHIYRDLEREARMADNLEEKIAAISAKAKNGEQHFSEEESYILRDLLIAVKDDDGRIVEVKKDAGKLNEAVKRCSLFCLLSSKEMDPFYALHCWQARKCIEEAFDVQNDAADEMHHIQTDDEYNGRLFAHFVSAGYWFFFNEAVKKVLARLREEAGAAKSQGGSKDYALKKELLDWLVQKSPVDVLDWFDAVEKIELHTPQASISVLTKSSPRDQLFVKMLKETASA